MSILSNDPLAPIVMVDDSEDDIDIARMCYEDSQVRNPFIGLRGGQELLDHLAAVDRSELPMPAVVLLDINMPGKDGFTVLQEVRSQGRFRRMPIIMMLTNSDNPRDIERSAACGANGYQTKLADVGDYIAFFNALAADDRLKAA